MNYTSGSDTQVTEVVIDAWGNPKPMFVVVWAPWKHEDDWDDRIRVWGVYSDEAESKKAYETARSSKSGLLKRGGFAWIRVENFDDVKPANQPFRDIDFELDDEDEPTSND